MTKPNWWKEPIKATGVTCPCCATTSEVLHLETTLYWGFGGYSVNKNGTTFYQAELEDDFDGAKTLKDIEEMIGEDHDSEYVVIVDMPLRSAKYQRHAKNTWVLIEKGDGFA